MQVAPATPAVLSIKPACRQSAGPVASSAPRAMPSTDPVRAGSFSNAASLVPVLASTSRAASNRSFSHDRLQTSPQLQTPSQSDARIPRPSSASGCNRNRNTCSPSRATDIMAAISKYPAHLPASQIQMHAAASAALCGPICEVGCLALSGIQKEATKSVNGHISFVRACFPPSIVYQA